mmetsp:Transcript_71397/g.180202  ORF Transcript_71397/g.180202 Transcript_71397/m.180202 type:complete len:313 (-) Transcript_71397:227-1165(-)
MHAYLSRKEIQSRVLQIRSIRHCQHHRSILRWFLKHLQLRQRSRSRHPRLMQVRVQWKMLRVEFLAPLAHQSAGNRHDPQAAHQKGEVQGASLHNPPLHWTRWIGKLQDCLWLAQSSRLRALACGHLMACEVVPGLVLMASPSVARNCISHLHQSPKRTWVAALPQRDLIRSLLHHQPHPRVRLRSRLPLKGGGSRVSQGALLIGAFGVTSARLRQVLGHPAQQEVRARPHLHPGGACRRETWQEAGRLHGSFKSGLRATLRSSSLAPPWRRLPSVQDVQGPRRPPCSPPRRVSGCARRARVAAALRELHIG